jgi:hypothetical protein
VSRGSLENTVYHNLHLSKQDQRAVIQLLGAEDCQAAGFIGRCRPCTAMCLCHKQCRNTSTDSCTIMHSVTQKTPSRSKCSTCIGRYWSIWHTVSISPPATSTFWATEAGIQGIPVPIRCSSGRSYRQHFPEVAFRILQERHLTLGDLVGCMSDSE